MKRSLSFVLLAFSVMTLSASAPAPRDETPVVVGHETELSVTELNFPPMEIHNYRLDIELVATIAPVYQVSYSYLAIKENERFASVALKLEIGQGRATYYLWDRPNYIYNTITKKSAPKNNSFNPGTDPIKQC